MRVPLLDRIYRGYAEEAAPVTPGSPVRVYAGAARLRFGAGAQTPAGGTPQIASGGFIAPTAVERPWPVWLVGFALLLAALKVWLILGDEVVARSADAAYLIAARDGYSGGGFGAGALAPPGYPLWLALVDVTSVPLRFAIEFLQIGAAFFFAWCIRRLGHGSWAAVLVFAAIIFQPISLDINNYVHPDTLYSPVLITAVAFLILHYSARDVPVGLLHGVAAGVLLALLTLTRPGAGVAAAWLALFGVVVFVSNLLRNWRWPAAGLQAALAVGVPLIVGLGTTLFVRTLNHDAFGVSAESEQTAPGSSANLAMGLPTAAGRMAESFGWLYLQFFQPWAPARERDDPAASPELTLLFDEVANRRRELTQWPTVQVSGWAFVSDDPWVSLKITDSDKRVVAVTDSFNERPDVAGFFSAARVPLKSGFSIRFPDLPFSPFTGDFTTASGRTFTYPVLRLLDRTWRISEGDELRLHIETVRRTGGRQRPLAPVAAQLENLISQHFGLVLLALSVAGVFGLITAALVPRSAARELPLRGPLVLMGGVVLIGMISVSAADVFIKPVSGYDAVFPLVGLYSALVILLLSQGINALWTRLQPVEPGPLEARQPLVGLSADKLIRP